MLINVRYDSFDNFFLLKVDKLRSNCPIKRYSSDPYTQKGSLKKIFRSI